jgi:hypothetical protein
MGLRATVITKYEIEYGKTQGFNYGADVLASLIYEFCNDYSVGDDGCGGSNTEAIWEVDVDEFAAMLEEIKKMSQEELDDIIGQHAFNDGWDKEEIVRVLQGFLDETPDNAIYVRFAWL